MTEKDDTSMVGGHDLADASNAEVRELEDALNPAARGSSSQDDDDDDDHHGSGDSTSGERIAKGDTELDEARTPEEREEIRARRRVERRNRKDNQRERMAALQRQQDNLITQNRQMAEQLARLQNNDNAARLSQLDAAIQEAAAAQAQALAVHADATAKADGVSAAKALDYLLKARDRHTQLTAVKDQVVATSRAPAATNIDPTVRNNALKFAKDNSWYKGPQANDQDSQIMTTLDTAVAKAGFDPASPEYWAELDARARRYLPHRYNTRAGDAGGEAPSELDSGYNADTTTRSRPRSPVGGAGNTGNRSTESEGGFKLSAERVKAMKEAGIWDDPARRQKMITKYRELDKQNS
jgi:hypothetical protein